MDKVYRNVPSECKCEHHSFFSSVFNIYGCVCRCACVCTSVMSNLVSVIEIYTDNPSLFFSLGGSLQESGISPVSLFKSSTTYTVRH